MATTSDHRMGQTEIEALVEASVGLGELAAGDFALLRRAIGDARVVLIGEETHGTEEFYRLRAEITQALITREGFSLVLCESDFPTFYHLHRFVGGTRASRESRASSSSVSTASGEVQSATGSSTTGRGMNVTEVMEVLKTRFPVWMWRNEPVRDFVEWLQQENLRKQLASATALPVALFGLDIYSMFASADQVIDYLSAVDPAMAELAKKRYAILQSFRPHEANYCRAVLRGAVPPQRNPIRKMVSELTAHADEFKHMFGDGDEYFSAHENARVVMAAEEYYRESYFGGSLTWNIRDRAMVDMIVNALRFHDEKLQELEGATAKPSRAVVWAHNSHIGDAAATEQFKRWGQVNVGHLVREALSVEGCFLVGLSTCTGTVRAATKWNGPDSVMALNPSIPGSTGSLLHAVATRRPPENRDFGLVFRSQQSLSTAECAARELLKVPRPERFIGVQYLKQTERQSHYSLCEMSSQYDLVIHLDTTSALKPLKNGAKAPDSM